METVNLRMHVYNMLNIAKQRCFLTVIAKESGVPEGWLKSFAGGKVSKPNVDYIQQLYEYLAKEPLALKDLQ